jgi:hypothetical protein
MIDLLIGVNYAIRLISKLIYNCLGGTLSAYNRMFAECQVDAVTVDNLVIVAA